jgi:hypothetical protein
MDFPVEVNRSSGSLPSLPSRIALLTLAIGIPPEGARGFVGVDRATVPPGKVILPHHNMFSCYNDRLSVNIISRHIRLKKFHYEGIFSPIGGIWV